MHPMIYHVKCVPQVDRSEGRRMRVVEVSDRRRVVFQEAVACDIAAAAGAAGPPAELVRFSSLEHTLTHLIIPRDAT